MAGFKNFLNIFGRVCRFFNTFNKFTPNEYEQRFTKKIKPNVIKFVYIISYSHKQ